MAIPISPGFGGTRITSVRMALSSRQMQPLRRYQSWPNPSTLNGNCFIYIIGEEDEPYYQGRYRPSSRETLDRGPSGQPSDSAPL